MSDAAMSTEPPPMTRRPLYLSSERPANGPVSAAMIVPKLNAPDIAVLDQPNSSSQAGIRTLNIGAATAPLSIMVSATTPATTHP